LQARVIRCGDVAETSRQGRNSLTIVARIGQGGSVTDSTRRFVVVGVDGSNGSAVALRWALDHADHLGDIEPVTTFVTGPMVREAGPPDAGDEPYRSEATLQQRAFLESHAPWLVESAIVLETRAGPGLVKAAVAAELLVVGTRGWGDRADLSVGSVGSYCARHSTVPVALIPPVVPAFHDHLDVVVGFDGSPHSRDALRWTLEHLRRSARVTVVRAFTDERVAGEVLRPADGRAEDSARRELENGVAAVLDHVPGHPPVEMAVLPGDPRAVLRSAGAGADLLVVGARGHGGLDLLLLGSVASALAHHPTVPTIVVPGIR
jgi:nucleotide-binding universal stress UspA family protein